MRGGTVTGNAVELRGVTKRFGTHLAVNDLTLSVPRGSIYGFIGPNGSGKTTTLRMLMNIFFPDQGEIDVLGERGRGAARDRVGYLPEERGLYKKMTVRKLLAYYGRLKNAPEAKLEASISQWISRMGLGDWADKKIETLSKGMSQKVQFIATVLSAPDLLILDEPFSGLDPVNAEVLRDAILAERKRGATIIFSTHDMNAAEKLCDRIFMIFRGKKVLDGTLHEIQAEYGQDTALIKTEQGAAALEGLPEVGGVVDHGNYQEVRLSGDPQTLLRTLVARGPVLRFELQKPSLDEIFKRIARPNAHGGEQAQEESRS
jgi:ABC-2 type transport system ATP-binding protein